MDAEISNNPVTLESLALSLKALETSIVGRLDRLDLNVIGVDVKIDASEKRLCARISAVETRSDSLEKRLEGFESHMGTALASLESQVGVIGNQLDNLELQVDGLAVITKREFEKVYIRLDEMNDNLVELKDHIEYKHNAFQGQLDNVFLNYSRRDEFEKLDKRVLSIEKKSRYLST